MCGIIFAHNKTGQDVNPAVVDQLEDQLHRGREGFGTVFVDAKMKLKSITRATELTKTLLDLHLNQAPFILMHHRTPTSSSNKIKQTHPFDISHGSLKHRYLVVVNGHVYNEDEMKKKHEDEYGYIYSTDNKADNEFNDCEALGWDLARLIEGQSTEIEARGSYAFIALQLTKDKVTRVFFGSNSTGGCPLKLAANEREIFISSEGKGEVIKANTLYECSTTTWKLNKRPLNIKTIVYASSHTPISRSLDDDEYEEYNRDVAKWKQDLKKADKPVEVSGFQDNGDLLKQCIENAKESIADFFAFVDKTSSPDDVIEALNDALSAASSEMMEGYYTLMSQGRQQLVESIVEEKAQELDLAGLSFVPEDSDVELLEPKYNAK
jgi:asparagine synthetase B (glutamine-hydrolysing)